jgi:predicted amidophosphoribosyltransferase
MSAISISIGLMIALVGVLVFDRMRKLPQIAGYGSQRMCPSCGLITSRLKACCLECGKPLTAVSVTPIVEK